MKPSHLALRDHKSNLNFLARKLELALLQNEFQNVLTGQTRIVFISGEPGIGKPRLLKEIPALASAPLPVVLMGGYTQIEGMQPYLPFLEAVGPFIKGHAHEKPPQEVKRLLPVLAQVFPEVPESWGKQSTAIPILPEQARLRFFEALGAFLAAYSTRQPLILCLDDLQWADPASLDLLLYIVKNNVACKLLIVGAYRSDNLENNPALNRVIQELNRLHLLTILKLGPLNRQEIELLAAKFLPHPVEPAFVQFLYQKSEGNPFFAEELLQTWLEEGDRPSPDRALAMSLIPLPPPSSLKEKVPTLPESIVYLIKQRVNRLSVQTQGFLHTAAIIGRNFDLLLLAEVLGQPVEVVEESLREAEVRGLLQASTEELFTFSHDLIRECLYDEVTFTRRKRLHGFIGRALELQNQLPVATAPVAGFTPTRKLDLERLADLSFHFIRSGDRSRGVKYACQAADQAMQKYAFEYAFQHYLVALEQSVGEDEGRGDLLMKAGLAALAWARLEDFKVEIVFGLETKAELLLIQAGSGSPDSQTEAAMALLQEAHTLAGQLGMAGEAAKLQQRLNTLVPTPSPSKDVKPALNYLLQNQPPSVTPSSSLPPVSVFPVKLSEREIEVLGLVAAGKSNQEIATELFLSIKTVGNHVSSILNKTGTTNRAGAAAFALRYGLV